MHKLFPDSLLAIQDLETIEVLMSVTTIPEETEKRIKESLRWKMCLEERYCVLTSDVTTYNEEEEATKLQKALEGTILLDYLSRQK
jgi:hypothetical protein